MSGPIKRIACLALMGSLLIGNSPAAAQSKETEHESHHPGAAQPSNPDPSPSAASAGAPMAGASAPAQAPPAMSAQPDAKQGMMGGMQKMMEGMMGSEGCCGGGAGKEIYPFLMSLPTLTPEKRAEVRRLSEERIYEGTMLLQTAQERLSTAIAAGDHDTAESALQQSRDGLGRVGSGVAVHKLLQEGTPPQNVASQWFKSETNLASPIAREDSRKVLGVLPLHLFVMALLIAFALAMVAMYFFKMRRTAALFGRIEPNPGAPPPGTSPPLGGAPNPSSPAGPPAGTTTPTGGTPPAGDAPPTGKASPPVGPPSQPSAPASAAKPAAATALPIEAPQANVASVPNAKWRGQLRIGSIITETPSVKTLRLQPVSGDGPMPFIFAPGQFLNVAFSVGGARMNRSYTISSSPTQRDHVDLTVKREPRGAVSRHVDDVLKVGDQIEAGGPVGKSTFTGTEADSVVLIAGGVGITPMMSIARYLTERSWPGDIFLVYACRAPVDFIFARDVAELQRVNKKLHVAVAMEHPEGTEWQGLRGRLTKELLAQTVPDIASRRIHLCGPPVMMDAVKAILTELKVPPDQVKTESFGSAAPTPGAAGTTAKSTAPATGPLVTFSKNNKSSKIHVDQTVLELSEELDIGIEFSCRVGTCGICKVKMTSGEVEMAVEDGLDPEDKANGMILACQAKPTGPVTVEA
ncbi:MULTISPECIES: 2Fe-2S iron-sulfur cluster-binding protein [unclassified Variovorax]|uniref:2Fe-2S iron-sulfur cluster-binding protein n=1 Tax=unclassified Variovorax TaxID=663243 RepID=UPI0011AF5B8D|nr:MULTISPECIES: 2Fe-2S iron-sulfur cluster-binding protein [unclassified Variovorax]